jgi:hypothetical protein
LTQINAAIWLSAFYPMPSEQPRLSLPNIFFGMDADDAFLDKESLRKPPH